MGFENNIKNYLAEQLNKMGLDIKAESIQLSIPPVKEHGDYSTNVALRYAKQLGKKGVEIANLLADECNVEGVTKVEVAGPGFLNFFVSNDLMTKRRQRNFGRRERWIDILWGELRTFS